MKSQIYDTDDRPNVGDRLAQINCEIREIDDQIEAIADRRRHLIEPPFKVVKAQPSEMFHKISIGAVLVNQGLQALHADPLAGLLESTVGELMTFASKVGWEDDNTTVGTVLAKILHWHERELQARGLFVTWQRRYLAYAEDRATWLLQDEQLRLHGAWREANITAGQGWLMRTTCRVRNIDMPQLPDRGAAAAWIEANGANLNYQDFIV